MDTTTPTASGQPTAATSLPPYTPPTPGHGPQDDLPGRSGAGRSPRACASRSAARTWALFAVFFVVLWALGGGGHFWPMWPILGWGLAVAAKGGFAAPHARW